MLDHITLHADEIHAALRNARAVLTLCGLDASTPDENVAAWCAEAITEARAAYEHGRGHVPYDVARVRRATLQTLTEAAALHLRAVKALETLRRVTEARRAE